ncbi:MAG: glycerol-3-phosphate dehydrogenase/oxidase [Gemmatimonadota bacterium]
MLDLVIVGGGVTGAGIARDAALRGLRVALFEREDFASGTSSRSSRMVHGGVRYLEHGHLHLVLESSRERRILLKIAPHLVRPLAFTWPLYAGARIAGWKLTAGLTLYDALALFRNVSRHRRLAPDEVLRTEPALRTESLRGGARYFDAAADDARLVLANVIAAVEQGAVALNHAVVEKVSRVSDASGEWALEVRDAAGNAAHQVRSRAVVFAIGPWSDDVPSIAGLAKPTARVVRSLGAHIAVPRARIGNSGALTLIAPSDGRVFFVVPARELTIATTTESPSHCAPAEVRAGRGDVAYLLNAVNHYFPAARLTNDDVIAAWAGLRPLAAPNVHGALTSASREHSIVESEPGMFVVTGGKLTTYRAMAEEVVDQLARRLLLRETHSVTQRVPLPGGELPDVPAAITAAHSVASDDAIAQRLVGAYGSRWPLVLGRNEDLQRIDVHAPYLLAEATYAVERELAVTLADVLIRRVPLAFERRDHAVAAAARVATHFATRFGWNGLDVRAAVDLYEQSVQRQFEIDDRMRDA